VKHLANDGEQKVWVTENVPAVKKDGKEVKPATWKKHRFRVDGYLTRWAKPELSIPYKLGIAEFQ